MAENKKTAASMSMKEKIISEMTDMMIRNGYRGTTYDMIAKRLGVTTTNIHYHFGGKDRLVCTVIERYVKETIQRHENIWLAPDKSLAEKIVLIKDFNRQRYYKFNTNRSGGHSWSLIARMRLESDCLPKEAHASLAGFAAKLEGYVGSAVDSAVKNHGLDPSAPVDEIVKVLLGLVHGAAVFTQMTGGFAELEDMYDSWIRIIEQAYGSTFQVQ
jgi:TetR/AcrR family transcriptional regulator, transcriptional repressor for nem operon